MIKKLLFLITFIFIGFLLSLDISANTYLSDKTEVEINLEVSGADAIEQTDDGYIWIGQYSGLVKYDSREFVTFMNFEENGNIYNLKNIYGLTHVNNTLYILTKNNFFRYEDNKFSTLNIDFDSYMEELGLQDKINLIGLKLDPTNSLIYICSYSGLFVYDIINDTSWMIEETQGIKVSDCDIYGESCQLIYSTSEGVIFNNTNIFPNTDIYEIYVYDDTLLIGTSNLGMTRYDLKNNKLYDVQFSIPQVNEFLYSKNDNIIYAATETSGLYVIDADTGDYSIDDQAKDTKYLSDILLDYEGNLWYSSRKPDKGSGLYMITKNSLLNLLYDDNIWKNEENRGVYSIERYGDILYIVGNFGVHFYDLVQKKIVVGSDNKNIITKAIEQYIIDKSITNDKTGYVTDVEVFKNKIYFSVLHIGILEYNPIDDTINIYGSDFINDPDNVIAINSYSNTGVLQPRCLRAFDDFLMIGYYNGGIIKFDGSKYTIYNCGKTVLNIKEASNGNILYTTTQKLSEIDENLTEPKELETAKIDTLNILIFIVDDNRIYYNLNDKLFYYEETEDGIINQEIVVPYVKGSIFELNKVQITDKNGNLSNKYVIVTQTQIYITDSLSEDNLNKDNYLINYELYDSTNGLESIANSTFGYYDSETENYYFQTSNGVFVYSFEQKKDVVIPIKMALNYVDIDGNKVFSDNFKVDKTTSRITFNLSVLAFRPNKGYKIFYKLDGIDSDYKEVIDDSTSISYMNLSGNDYKFHAYVIDEYGNRSNEIEVSFVKPKKFIEYPIFWVIIVIISLLAIAGINIFFIRRRIKKAVEREKEYKAITIESIEAIARTIDVKDSYTNGHSIRVGHFSRIIAEELGMEGDDLENLYYIALLHDIGKIGIPDAILNKPGKLTDEEFEIMKSHTTKGAKILKDISTIPNIVEGAKYHHERYGGGGYPEGLKGEEIPYIARIICCADCYDAMATRRVYKDPYPKEKIISEFERCSGIQFDPKMAKIVIELIKDGKLKPIE